MDISILEEAGLSPREAKVYLAMLEAGPSLAGVLARKTGVHRRNIYDILDRLIKNGLVGYILRNNRRIFEASSPNRFLDLIKEKENSVSEILPEMLLLYGNTKEKQETNFYKGKEGLKAVFQDQLEENNEKYVLILGASESAFDILLFYFKWYDKDRIKKKIKARIIANSRFKKPSFSEVRYLPEKYTNPLAINIYKDKTAIILWSKENPIAIVIKNNEIAEGYKKYFELMWKIARKG